jgi:magnesium and cobalt exporter, CNNM family
MSLFTIPLTASLIVVAWLTAGGVAVRSVSRIWLRHWAERQLRGSAAAVSYLERPHRLLTSVSAGVAVTLVLAGMAVDVGAVGANVIWNSMLLAGTVVLFGQLIPRAIARRWPVVIAPLVFPLLRLVDLFMRPVIAAGAVLARPLVRERPEAPPGSERDTIQDLLREGELEGVGERDEIAIISGVVKFTEKVVRDVMTPRSDIFALPDGVDAHTLATQIAQSGYSRVPIYHGTLDAIMGMVHAFDVIKAHGDTPSALRQVAFAAPESPCNELLFRMLRERRHLAIVRNDRGQTMGLVTLEDLLEELVGDIRDEHDEPAPPRPAK